MEFRMVQVKWTSSYSMMSAPVSVCFYLSREYYVCRLNSSGNYVDFSLNKADLEVILIFCRLRLAYSLRSYI